MIACLPDCIFYFLSLCVCECVHARKYCQDQFAHSHTITLYQQTARKDNADEVNCIPRPCVFVDGSSVLIAC